MLIISAIHADEIVWTDISDQYSFPSGISLFRGNRNTPALECFYLDVDLNDTNLAVRPYVSSNSKDVRTFASDIECIAAVNGGYFGGNIPYSTVIVPGQVKAVNVPAVTRNSQSYPVIRSMFSLNADFTPSINWVYHFGSTLNDVYSFSQPLNYSYNDPNPEPAPQKSNGSQMEDLLVAIGGGPVLVKDSLIHITYNEEVMWGSGVGYTNRDPRTALGYTSDGHILILCADGRQTHSEGLDLSEMASIFLEKGCVAAVNLDGGGSTQMAIPGTYINRPSETRAVPAILSITYRDSCRLPVEDGYSVIIDTEDNDYVSKTGSWFPSANSGYWGDTKALLSGCGDGSSVLSFSTSLNETRSCDVYGWWVADPNRSSETPYVIIHENGRDTVRVNQRQDHAQWNLIGTYTFSSDPGHAVMVSNDASTGSYVVADAIKLQSDRPLNLLTNTNIAILEKEDIDIISIYPNPFNPRTIIDYDLRNSAHTRLEIYDLHGNKIKTLINEIQEKGTHRVIYDAGDLASGLYLCSIKQGMNYDIEKITLLK